MRRKILKDKKGITLIALVITIIVMIILVAVTITMALNGGLFNYAGNATKDTELAKQDEQKIAEGKVEVYGKKYNTIDEYINAKPQYSKQFLNSDGFLTTTVEYTDINNDTAIIPKGYKVSEKDEEQIIKDGLVIKDELENEFVWIPVPKKDMEIGTLNNPHLVETYCKEPVELTAIDGNEPPYDSQETMDDNFGDGYFTYENDFKYEEHYKEMVECVNKYAGFYVGRYETTIDSNKNIGSKLNTTVLTSMTKLKDGINQNHSSSYYKYFYYRWWGQYYGQRHANVAENGETVQTNMIWGQQWDKMIEYFNSINQSYPVIDSTTYNIPSELKESGQALYINKKDNNEEIKDEIFNIFDLRMNAYDWTAEGNGSFHRIHRGGCYNDSYGDLNSRFYDLPVALASNRKSLFGSRMTMYIK